MSMVVRISWGDFSSPGSLLGAARAQRTPVLLAFSAAMLVLVVPLLLLLLSAAVIGSIVYLLATAVVTVTATVRRWLSPAPRTLERRNVRILD